MELPSLVAAQRRYHASGATRGERARRDALDALVVGLEKHESAILDALGEDSGKPPAEAFLTEIARVRGEARHARRRLHSWMKPERRSSPLLAWPARSVVERDPAGVALILGPWNYPVQLLLGPLVPALAAGNCAVLKPSELAPATARVVARLVADCFDPAHVTVVQGDAEVAARLQEERFDHVFFTGSTATGRKVMAAAARHLTPVTLELGGKCPTLVFPRRGGAELDTMARRIAWGKCLNAGQTCVAPDHIWVDRRWHDEFVEALGHAFDHYAGHATSRIIHERHFDRLAGFLKDGHLIHGHAPDRGRLHFPPAILTGVARTSPVMREEIFGPVLPVLPCDSPEDALEAITAMPSPLAVYLFTPDREVVEAFRRGTRSGGLCVNDVIVHITGNELPFGGVGESGMGRYRGKAGFDTFTRERVVMRRTLWPDLPFRDSAAGRSLDALKRLPKRFTEG